MRVLHLHNWALKDILPHLTKIKNQKFDTILVGPIHDFQKDTLNNLSILAKNAQKEGLSCHLEIPLSFFAHLNMYELYFLFNTLEETGINGFYFENILKITKRQIKTDLLPVLKRHEHLDNVQKETIEYLEELLAMQQNDYEFLTCMERKEYKPALLFSKTNLDRIEKHPMALWKCR